MAFGEKYSAWKCRDSLRHNWTRYKPQKQKVILVILVAAVNTNWCKHMFLLFYMMNSHENENVCIIVEPYSSISVLHCTNRRCHVATWQQFVVSQLSSQSVEWVLCSRFARLHLDRWSSSVSFYQGVFQLLAYQKQWSWKC